MLKLKLKTEKKVEDSVKYVQKDVREAMGIFLATINASTKFEVFISTQYKDTKGDT